MYSPLHHRMWPCAVVLMAGYAVTSEAQAAGKERGKVVRPPIQLSDLEKATQEIVRLNQGQMDWIRADRKSAGINPDTDRICLSLFRYYEAESTRWKTLTQRTQEGLKAKRIEKGKVADPLVISRHYDDWLQSLVLSQRARKPQPMDSQYVKFHVAKLRIAAGLLGVTLPQEITSEWLLKLQFTAVPNYPM